MIKGTPELIAKRREEIINACEKRYQTMSFKEITLKEIGKITYSNSKLTENRIWRMGMMETVDVNAEFEKLYFDIAGDPEPVNRTEEGRCYVQCKNE